VHRGIVDLARETGACIVVAGVFSTSGAHILRRTWDRTQLPRPFSTLTAPLPDADRSRDFADVASLRERVSTELLALEQAFDPAKRATRAACRRVPTARLQQEAHDDRPS
jgi:lysophospholipid acyltransferase (LPLAT)-like uncharacterized protein